MNRTGFLKVLGAGVAVGACPTLLAKEKNDFYSPVHSIVSRQIPDPYDEIEITDYPCKNPIYKVLNIVGFRRIVISDSLFPTFECDNSLGPGRSITFAGMKHKNRWGNLTTFVGDRIKKRNQYSSIELDYYVTCVFCKQYPDLMSLMVDTYLCIPDTKEDMEKGWIWWRCRRWIDPITSNSFQRSDDPKEHWRMVWEGEQELKDILIEP